MSSMMRRAVPHMPSLEEESAEAITGLILDCDGVLFDSKEANTAYYNHIRYAVQLPPMTQDEADYSHMLSTDEALDRMIPEELRQGALNARNQMRYRDLFMSLMQPSPHVFSFLDSMKQRGMRLGLCTNRSDSVHEVLQHFSMDTYFSPVMTITHARPKPDPEGLLEVIKIWDAAPCSVAFLGDSLVDQQAAAAAGVPFWSFNNPQLSARVHVSSFKELNDILQIMLMR